MSRARFVIIFEGFKKSFRKLSVNNIKMVAKV